MLRKNHLCTFCTFFGKVPTDLILTVLDRYHPGQNYRIAEEILHNRDRVWMNEYILNSLP